jgi:hypothetical protein
MLPVNLTSNMTLRGLGPQDFVSRSICCQWDSLLTVLRELFPPDTGGANDKEGPPVIASL